MNKKAWVTYLCDNTFLEGVICLKKSLLLVNSKFELACMITEDVSQQTIEELELHKIKTIHVDKIFTKRNKGIKDRYFQNSWMMFTKINLWALSDYDQLVYLDADVLVLQNSDSLFDINNNFCAVKDPGYNGINAGVMILKPNKETFHEMKSLIDSELYDNTYSDQSFTNWFYTIYKKDILYLPYNYNVLQKRTSYEQFCKHISIFHYNGQKPWLNNIKHVNHKCFWQQNKNIEYNLWHTIRKNNE